MLEAMCNHAHNLKLSIFAPSKLLIIVFVLMSQGCVCVCVGQRLPQTQLAQTGCITLSVASAWLHERLMQTHTHRGSDMDTHTCVVDGTCLAQDRWHWSWCQWIRLSKVGRGVSESSMHLSTNLDHSYETEMHLITHRETIQHEEGTNINYATLIKRQEHVRTPRDTG